MKKKKGTMFKTILGSYIIICMVIVGITMVINTVMSSMLKKEMIENTRRWKSTPFCLELKKDLYCLSLGIL